MPTTPNEGVDTADASNLTVDDATNSFLNRWVDAGTLSDTDEGEKARAKAKGTPADEELDEEEDDLELEDEIVDDEESDDDDGKDPTKKIDAALEAADDHVVKVTIDGEERKVKVKDLKRLYGQEASLTRKSQEVAAAKTKAEETGAKYVAATGKLLEKANTRYAPYAQVDWQIAQKTLSNEEFVALRTEAVAAYQDIQFLNTEVNTVIQADTAARDVERMEQAKEAIGVLEKDIPNFGPDMYRSICDYAVTTGLSRESVSNIVDPAVLKIINQARLYSQAKSKALSKKSAASPARVLKTSGKNSSGNPRSSSSAEMKALRNSGSTQDAANAFLARWASSGD